MLMYVPIDMPPCPKLHLSHLPFWNHGPATESEDHSWEMTKLTEVEHDESGKDTYAPKSMYSQFAKANPNFVDWLKHLPYRHIINLKILRQNTKHGAGLHVDLLQPGKDLPLYHHTIFNEPLGYRVLVKGKRKDCLYTLDRNQERVYCNLPESTNVWCQNHSANLHGAEPDEGREVLFMHLIVVPDEHRSLLQKSLAKYGDYAIRFNYGCEI